MINEKRLLDNFMDYVQIDSVTMHEKKMAMKMIDVLKSLGGQVHYDECGKNFGSDGGNVYAFFKGNIDGESLLFSSHMDTVFPGEGIEPIILGTKILSKGETILAADDKSGIAAIIEALMTIKEKNISHGDIEILFTIGEEGGLRGAKAFDYNLIQSKQAFVLDSGGTVGHCVVQAPAQNKMIFTVKGKAAHAGMEPENGISAIMVASEAISKMNLLRIDEETTANIGSFHGGEVTNIVCPTATIIAEARSLSDEKVQKQTDHMVKCFNEAAQKYGTEVQHEVIKMYPSFNLPLDAPVLSLVSESCQRLGLNYCPESTGGGSDANIMFSKGLEVVNLGTGMNKCHTVDEFIELEDLYNASKLVLDIMTHA